MRGLSRIGCTLAGLALAAPAACWAEAPAPAPAAPAAHKHKKSWFGKQHLCVECQREKARAEAGVNVPPPPALPGQVFQSGNCTACGATTLASNSGSQASAGNALMARNDAGHALVGGEEAAYASVGNEPAPIGVVQSRLAAASAAPAPNGRGPAAPGSRDPSVGISSYSPAPPTVPGANRPHVLSHLLGVSAIGRDRREERARHKGEKHASIPYGPQTPTVNDLPAKVVYGR